MSLKIKNIFSDIMSSIHEIECFKLDDFYSDFIMDLIKLLPKLKNVSVSDLNFGDNFCERFA